MEASGGRVGRLVHADIDKAIASTSKFVFGNLFMENIFFKSEGRIGSTNT
jgi:hypothetical protein